MLPLLIKYINIQLEFNKGKSLFYHTPGESIILKPSKEMVIFLIENRDEIQKTIIELRTCQKIGDFANEISQEIIKMFIGINQYISFREKDIKQLEEIYLSLFHQFEYLYKNAQINENKIEQILKQNYLKLRNFLLDTNGYQLFKIYKNEPYVRKIPCAEYDAKFQMKLLHLKLDEKEPVLDIGCGSKALLVNYLRDNGIEAYGVDRVENTSSYIYLSNWLDFDFLQKKWGTIVSNMAFSNHFWHHHLRKDGNFKIYAKKYMEILQALKVNGSFIYSPGLPFIEKILEDNSRYTITRNYLMEQGEESSFEYLRFYVTRIIKNN